MERNAISAFIDNELQLDEKLDFLHAVRNDSEFSGEAVALIQQEIVLRKTDGMPPPPPILAAIPAFRDRWRWLKPMGLFGGGLATALVLIGLLWGMMASPIRHQSHRFVVYQPGASQAAIIGDFTDWKAVKMRPAGHAGYWEVVLPLQAGEHRYSFLMDGQPPMADPTQPDTERDDFGGQNSIILIPPETRI